MFGKMITGMAAKVSLSKYSAYIGTKACEGLGVGKNDGIKVTFPNAGPGDSDITVKGHLNQGSQITVPVDVTRMVADHAFEGANSTQHIQAIVEKTNQSWGDDKEPTERRWQGHYHLDGEVQR